MRKSFFLILLSILYLECKNTPESIQSLAINPLSERDAKISLSPEERYGALFDSIIINSVFDDSTTFLNCVPKTTTDSILMAYEAVKKNPDFNLQSFVNQYFTIPNNPVSNYQNNPSKSLEQHINSLWSILNRKADTSDLGTSLLLPKPYSVAQGEATDVGYQEAYFTMLGLQATGQNKLIENMVDNFATLINTEGYVPKRNRTYYLTRTEQPFFSCMVQLLATTQNSDKIYVKYLPQLEKEYNFWMNGKPEEVERETSWKNRIVCIDRNVLNRYRGEKDLPRPEFYLKDKEWAKKSGQDIKRFYQQLRACSETGWDFSSRWFSNEKDFFNINTTDILPVDLNSLLYNLELVIMKGKVIEKKFDEAAKYEKLASKRREAVMRYCWSSEKEMFFDFDFQSYKMKTVYSLAGMYPLFFKMVTKKQADKVAANLEKLFLRPGGVVCTLNNTGHDFDAPYSTAALHWITIQALRNYGHYDLARDIKNRWIELNTNVYKSTGKILDRYNVDDVTMNPDSISYKSQTGYASTNGVLLKLLKEKD